MKIDFLEVSAYRIPVKKPVATSFGVMRDRPAVFVKLVADDGSFGWGEIFANWPAAGAEHRARLLVMDIADILFEIDGETPESFWQELDAKTRIRAVQCGEIGPFDQVIAGLDTAINDIAARKAGLPMAKYLNGENARRSVPVYASGIAAYAADEEVARARAEGIRNFKLKVGFDTDSDLATLGRISTGLLEGERLFTDANQAWDVTQAADFLAKAEAFGLGWIEEPIPARSKLEDWKILASKTEIPIAAGENMVGDTVFDEAIASGVFSYLQPDVAKWGGISRCYATARKTLDAGRIYCPHFLGGGIGLIASAHLLAATGGDGLLEVDINPNQLRDAFLDGEMVNGEWQLPETPGLGIEQLPEEISEFQTLTLSRTRN
ncbi:MAG: mandelate racemase/muconate lactonizing enzyme family protein [Rhizobiaceae bacterium]|nr:mandelate racemase/muconate lactonizing enzyme family protein [Rhizobiaceae bacterium]